jgi:hypothetical protein
VTRRRRELVTLAVLTGVLVTSVLWHPLDDGGFVLCLFRRSTGLPCMGCGLTRSFCAMGKGEVARAASFHALGPLLFGAAVVFWLRSIAAVAGLDDAVRRFDAFVARWRLLYVGVAALLVAWVVRLAILGYTGELTALLRSGPLGHR